MNWFDSMASVPPEEDAGGKDGEAADAVVVVVAVVASVVEVETVETEEENRLSILWASVECFFGLGIDAADVAAVDAAVAVSGLAVVEVVAFVKECHLFCCQEDFDDFGFETFGEYCHGCCYSLMDVRMFDVLTKVLEPVRKKKWNRFF